MNASLSITLCKGYKYLKPYSFLFLLGISLFQSYNIPII
jgi:hypothetical protein